jgi:hypothetical protein
MRAAASRLYHGPACDWNCAQEVGGQCSRLLLRHTMTAWQKCWSFGRKSGVLCCLDMIQAPGTSHISIRWRSHLRCACPVVEIVGKQVIVENHAYVLERGRSENGTRGTDTHGTFNLSVPAGLIVSTRQEIAEAFLQPCQGSSIAVKLLW